VTLAIINQPTDDYLNGLLTGGQLSGTLSS